jgi:hypothetical protein
MNSPRSNKLAQLVVLLGAVLLGSYAAYPLLRHWRNAHRPPPPPAAPPNSELPQPVANLTATPQPDGSLKLTWTGGARCDGFLISKTWPAAGKWERIADVPAAQLTYTVARSPGEAWDYDIWVEGHCARIGFGAPQRIRPPPAPDSLQSAPATAP